MNHPLTNATKPRGRNRKSGSLQGLGVLSLIVVLFSFINVGLGQTCEPPPIQFNKQTENIFTPEQEMFLGEAILEKVRNSYGLIDDPAVLAYLNQVGERLSRHLPNSGIRFRFMVSDIPDTNAFAFPGGIIMVTRKMVNFVKNEDELAGILAHELGHATVRHGGIDYSKYFKEILNVTKLGDRSDVFEKYNQFIDRRNTRNVRTSDDHENNQQLEADKIGMFALVAAGYDGTQFPQFWARFTKAKKRSALAEFFGGGRPADARLKEMLEQFKSLPTSCREQMAVGATKEFEDWRSLVVAFDNSAKSEFVPGLIDRKELVPLRSDVEYLKFSPNGEYLISQDSSTITVLKRNPLTVLFQVPADDSRPAEFSTDSTHLITVTNNLHVQKWNIVGHKLISDHEISVPLGFWQTRVSPNGDVAAAYHYNGDLALYDIKTGDEIFREKKFYLPTYFEYWGWQLAREFSDDSELTLLTMKFSPDGRYFLAGRQFSTRMTVNNERSVVVDIAERKEIKVGNNVKDLIKSSFGFLSPDTIVGRPGTDNKRAGIFAFPSGERLDQFELGGVSFTKSTTGDNLVVRPVSGAAVGIFDLKSKKYVFAGKKSALDVVDDLVVAERKNGELAVYTIGQSEPVATIELPRSEFGRLRTVAFSDDGEWLVASDKSRGAVWDLKTGERMFHLRSFRGNYIADDGKVYADFPAIGESPRSIATMDLVSQTITAGPGVNEGNMRQHGRYVVIRRPLKEENEKKAKENDKESKLFTEEEADKWVDFRRTSLEMRDARSGTKLWSREFENETPTYFISPRNDTMAFLWRLRAKAASEIVKANTGLSEKAKAMGDGVGDYLIQIIDPATGAVKNHFLLETGKGSFSVQSITIAGDLLIVDDNQNRQLVYSISSGSLIRRFFGMRSAVSSQNGLIAIENISGRVSVIEIATGKQIGQLQFRKGISVLSFSLDGKKLFVLTDDQVSFIFDVQKLSGQERHVETEAF